MGIASSKSSTSPKGLITEFSELTFPEGATVDELNCLVGTNGKIRKRRKGISKETNHVLSSFSVTDTQKIYETTWYNVGGISSLEFLVVQVGSMIYFYDKSTDPISDGEKSFTLDLLTLAASNGVDIANNRAETASLDGVLVVAHEGCDLAFITYDPITDSISTSKINPKIRDFEYVGTKEDYFVKGALTSTRQYDTRNSGWPQSAINGYKNANSGLMPPLTHSFFSGRDTEDNFSPSEFDKVFSGNSLSGNGSFIVDFFSKNRNISGSSSEIVIEKARFKTVASFGSRFWYAGLSSEKNNGKILFTKVIIDSSDYETCYQVNDPTSEIISDLLASDGGEINIPEAFSIRKLFAFGSSLVVFADNGIWSINGVDGVFKPTEFSITKVSSVGILDTNTFVDVKGVPFWWSKTGIHSLQVGQISAEPEEVSITENTIKTFWEEIGIENQLVSKGVYDEFNREIVWIYPNVTESNKAKFNRVLIFNLELGSFTPWEVGDQATNTSYIAGVFFNPFVTSSSNNTSVTVLNEDVTVEGDTVTVQSFFNVTRDSTEIKFLIKDSVTNKLTIGEFSSSTFLDWGEADYTSFFVPTPITMDSWVLEKSPLYIVTYLNQTENNFVDNGDGSYSLDTPSSCLLSISTDFNETFGPTQQVYRLKRFPYVDPSNLAFNYPYDSVITKTKIRGKGKVVKLKFSSEKGKDFQLKGYEIVGYLNEKI